MPFDWMDTKPSEAQRHRGAEIRVATYVEEVRHRASMLRRLGYDADYALQRCSGNMAWAYDVAGTPAITKGDLKRLVTEVYDR